MKKCRICEFVDKLNEEFLVKEMMFGTNQMFNYFMCSNCGCLQISDLPENINLYYQDYYTDYVKWNKISFLKRILWQLRSLISNYKIYSFIEKVRPNNILKWKNIAGIKMDSKILDVGCGSGDILYEFRKHGFRNLTGIDINLKENIRNGGIDLFRRSIFEMERKFDFIMFNHSFEHIWEQHETLEKAKNLLEENGVILLRLPVINAAFYIYRENWVQIDAPRHFYIHSLNSINILCNQHGLNIFHKYFDSSEFQFAGSEQYKLNIPLNANNSYYKNPSDSIFTKKDIEYYRKEAVLLNKEEKGDSVVLFINRIEEN
jgi:SAM-dependent methyltransferase